MSEQAKSGPSRSAADKERSRQQSRPVSGKTETGNRAKGAANGAAQAKGARTPASARGGQGAKGPGGSARAQGAGGSKTGGGGRPGRPGGRPTAVAGPRRPLSFFLTWGTVGLVVVIIVVLVVVKLTGGTTPPATGVGSFPAPIQVVQDVQGVPASVFSTVGITSPATSVTPPTVIKTKQPALTLNGHPEIFFLGGEYCPYCAAERWALTVALSRFGKFTNLRATASSPTDQFPNTQTLSYYKATYTSPYISFVPVEHWSNVPAASGGYQTLQSLTAAEIKLINTYSSAKYLGSQASAGAIPFVDIANKALVSGASYSPSILAGASRNEIAANLSDAKNPITQTIITSANYISAAICSATGLQPSAVCSSKGVTLAAGAMGLTSKG